MDNSLANKHPKLISEWSEKNYPLAPDTVTFGSNKVMWWKSSCGHEWQASIKARSSGENCPICSGARVARVLLVDSTIRIFMRKLRRRDVRKV